SVSAPGRGVHVNARRSPGARATIVESDVSRLSAAAGTAAIATASAAIAAPRRALRSTRLPELLRDALRLQEQQQVVASAGLRVGAAHVEAAERVRADDRAGALAVDVQVADEELALRALDLLRVLRVHRAGQPV